MTRRNLPMIDVGQQMEPDPRPRFYGHPDMTPVLGRANVAGIPFESMFSVCDPQFSPITRIDPFWGGVWAPGTSDVHWTSKGLCP